MRHASALLVCLLALPCLCAQTPRRALAVKPVLASGEQRVALVIGNGAYAASPLRNPVHDARAMARMLKEYGFAVTELEDAGQQRMDEAIRAFRVELGQGRGVGLFFFAGHGVSVEGRNFLLPVGQVFESEGDVKYKATEAGYVLSAMEDAGARVSLLILDACRNNPFGARSPFRGGSRGLVGMEAPKGSLVAFATAPGSTAADGQGENGLYTGELIRTIHELPNLEVEELLKKVSARVQAGSGGSQVPFRSSSLTGDFYFQPGGAEVEAAPALPAPRPALSAEPFQLLGQCAFSGAGGADLAIDATLKRVYLAGGMGQQGLVRIEASDPARMTQTVLRQGGGVAVDSRTGRYATTDGYGGTLYVYNPDDSLYDRASLSGCGGSLDADPASGRFFISTQCNDHVAVYSEGARALVANVEGGGVGSLVLFESGTGTVFENLTPNRRRGGLIAPLALDGAYGASQPFTGFLSAVDGALGHLYVNDGASLRVLDASTYATLHTYPGLTGFVVADTAAGRFYTASANSDALGVYDAASFAQLGTYRLPGNPTTLRMAPGDDRLYVTSGTRLYVLGR